MGETYDVIVIQSTCVWSKAGSLICGGKCYSGCHNGYIVDSGELHLSMAMEGEFNVMGRV